MSTPSLRRLSAAAGALLCASAQAQAPASTTRLDPINVIASRAEQRQADTLGDVSVIDRDTLARAGQSSLAEVLQREHGIEIGVNGGPQTTTSVFMRGTNSRHVLVLIDGQRIGSATTGGMGFNGVPLDSVERIEILRGAASSLYGADAIGGVINIVTRRPDAGQPLRIGGSVGAGSRDTYKAQVNLDGAQGMWTYGLQYGKAKSRGLDTTRPYSFAANPDRDGYEQEHASARLGLTWAPGHRVEASAYHSRINGQYDNGAVNDARAVTRVQAYALSSTDRINSVWTSRVRLGRTFDDYRDYGNGAQRSQARTRQDQVSWQNDLALGSGQSLSLIGEHLREEVLSTTLAAGYPASRNTNSVAAVYRGTFGAHHLQANLRHDHNTQYRGKTSGGLSYGYDLTAHWQLVAGASTGFRSPTYADLYGYGANPNLRPERSRNIEAGVRYRKDGTSASITAFRNRLTDMIVWVDDGTGTWTGTNTNIDRATIKGINLSLAQQLGATTLRASLDWQDPIDATTRQQLPRRARSTLRLGADHRLQAWLFGAEWLTTGPRVDFAGSTSPRMGGYSLLNLTAAYDVNRQTQVQVRWNNVTGKHYELAEGYRPLGSTVFVNVAYRP